MSDEILVLRNCSGDFVDGQGLGRILAMAAVIHVVRGRVRVGLAREDAFDIARDETLLIRQAVAESIAPIGSDTEALVFPLLSLEGCPTTGEPLIIRGDPDLADTGRRIAKIAGSPSSLRPVVLESAAAYFACLAAMKSEREGALPGHRDSRYWVDYGRKLIKSHLDSQAPLKEICREVPYTYEHFLRLFKTHVGLTPHEYRETKRIDRARELLRDHERSITSLAYALGYSSSQHFATNFKKQIGKTPREYRTTVAQWLVDSRDLS
jgi:AraC-like DNA-binding protein